MTVTVDDVIAVKVTPGMIERASFLAEKKLGVRKKKDGTFERVGNDNIYDRYNYNVEDRWKKIYIGELAEEASREFITSLKIPFVCYNDARSDEFRDDDPFDYKVGDFLIDIKGSRDNNQHGIEKIVKNQFLVTPIDQTVKPVIVQTFMNFEETTIWLTAWATEEELRKVENIHLLGLGPQGGAKYYMLRIRDCHPLSSLKGYLHDGALPLDEDHMDRDLIVGLIRGLGEVFIDRLKTQLSITTCRQIIDAEDDSLLSLGRVTKERITDWKARAKNSIRLYAHSKKFSET